jgi:general transcription factor 3C polypeptide 3 (transcription factor C subunit 4)
MPLMTDSRQLGFAAQVLRTAFDFHTQSPPESSSMKLQDIVSLVDCALQLDHLEEALLVIRRGQRWLQGRMEQKSWDSFEDDREYDPPGFSRDGNEESLGSFPMDVNLRHRLALTRVRLGNDVEAGIHIEEILHLEVLEHQALFIELGQACIKRELWEKALDCLAPIQENEDVRNDCSH